MNRHLLPALLCICATGAIAQQLRTGSSSDRQDQHEQRRLGLRNDLKQGQVEAVPGRSRDESVPAPLPTVRHLSAGEHAELRQQLRQQQIEAIRQRP